MLVLLVQIELPHFIASHNLAPMLVLVEYDVVIVLLQMLVHSFLLLPLTYKGGFTFVLDFSS